MPDRTPHHRVTCRTLALGLVALLGLAAVTTAASRPRGLPPSAVVVQGVPPDACVAFYGSGPCREHGMTVVGSTDAVALWPVPDEERLAASAPVERRR